MERASRRSIVGAMHMFNCVYSAASSLAGAHGEPSPSAQLMSLDMSSLRSRTQSPYHARDMVSEVGMRQLFS